MLKPFRVLAVIAGIAAGTFMSSLVSATEFGSGRLPVAYEPTQPVGLVAGSEIAIEGVVEGGSGATVVLRVDDGSSSDYSSRMNSERRLPLGPFRLAIPVDALRAENGRKLDAGDIRRVIFFATEGGERVSVSRFETSTAAAPQPSTVPATAAPAAASGAQAVQFGSGRLPVAYEPTQPVALVAGSEIAIEGVVEGGSGATVVLRVDDGSSSDYSSRMNSERRLPLGPFRLAIPVDALRAENGRKLDAGDIRRVIFFATEGGERISVSRFETSTAAASQPSTVPATAAPAAASGSQAVQFGSGRLPISYKPGSSVRFSIKDEIRIDGYNHGDSAVGVVLRIDDSQSSGYSSRFNDERMFPPGPFHYVRSLSGLNSTSGRILVPRAIQRIVLGVYEGAGPVTVSRFEAGQVAGLPAGAHGYALGADDAVLPSGFERIGPRDARLEGSDISVVRRPGPDPLVANGLRGVRRLTLPAEPGLVRVRIWIEDPGEWELLPHPLERHIRVNQKEAVSIKETFTQWIEKRYLRGRKVEHTASDDAWTAYGSHRGEPHAVEVEVGDKGIEIELQGYAPDSLYLSAVLIEPAVQTAGFDHVEAMRAAWYRSNYMVEKSDADTEQAAVAVLVTSSPTHPPQAARIVAAPDSGGRIEFAVSSVTTIASPSISVEEPISGGRKLDVKLWAGERRLERLAGNLLTLTDNRLLADLKALPITPGKPRTYELWINVPPEAKPGSYIGAVSFGSDDGARHRVQVEVKVLPVQLPPLLKPAGFYLAEAPQLTWFAPLVVQRSLQVACDLDFMRSFGLTGTAPPAAVPRPRRFTAFLNDMQIANDHGVAPGWLVYNPTDAVVESLGNAGAAELLGNVAEALEFKGIPPPVWSVADEPSNHADPGSAPLGDWIKELRTRAPKMRLAGHLNAARDEAFAPLFDTIIINEGFGLDANRIQRMASQGRDVWLYNTGAPRMTAGLWLWATAAKRYVQWHARMPTADPFDPLDGREGDAQMIYPSSEVCPNQPDIHRGLLEAAEGIVDQRWLLWLDRQSSPQAQRLLVAIKSKLGGGWKEAAKLSDVDMNNIRNAIIALAQQSG